MDKKLFGKMREVISRHGQKRKEMDLVPRKGEDRKTDDRFYRHQSIVKQVVEKRGLWDNIHAKQKRIKAGSGEHMRKPGEKGRPTEADFKRSQTKEDINTTFEDMLNEIV